MQDLICVGCKIVSQTLSEKGLKNILPDLTALA
jgi:hypothetical protein